MHQGFSRLCRNKYAGPNEAAEAAPAKEFQWRLQVEGSKAKGS